ncbi:MAG: DNA mismatch repair protein MutS, partial [Eudoraea sp.]|nr:DNA mismatch repair protein MutS [Eudoraea sp.]
MNKIVQKSLQDLEFPTVLEQVAKRCNTLLGKERIKELKPLSNKEAILNALGCTSEYLSSFTNENRIPNHGFDAIDAELRLLKIENTTLEIPGFRRIKHICLTVSDHKKFFKKFKEYYPLLFQVSESVENLKQLPEYIDGVIDKFGKVRDDASPDLQSIRRNMGLVKSKINQSFGAALARYQASEFLDEIRESVVENRRVLAVKSMYRKKVKGTVMGTSKTGSIIYIEPEASLRYSRELSNLEFDEKEEIQRILNTLTDRIRPSVELLNTYQDYLATIDLTAAKAKYAAEMNAILPDFNDDKKLFLKDAYHPLLYLNNKYTKETTYPQTIELHPENRIIVISGPNAGGKSITLKTIGLLQIMLQSGLLIP